MSAHSPLAPSLAHRWVPCPGSVTLEAQFPETEEGESAAEGTAAHHVGSEDLLGREVREGDVAPNGVIVTDEMLEGAALWVEDVVTVAGIENSHLMVEQRVTMPRIFSGPVKCANCEGHGVIGYTTGQTAESFEQGEYSCEACSGTGQVDGSAFGTPDTWFYRPDLAKLWVWDFKFGHGVVEAFENWQMLAYTCGILDLLGIDGRNDQHLWVHMRVVQPRAFHRDGRVREWKVLACDLRGYFNRLHDAAHEAMSANPHTQSGPHCLHCRAAHACPTLKRATWSAADYLGGHVAEHLPNEAAAYELQLLEHMQQLLKARVAAREADIEARLKRGEAVSDYTLEPTYGRTVFPATATDDVLMLADLCGVDVRKPQQLLTPNQASKLFKQKGVDASVILEYSHSPRTGQKLVRDTNLLNRARAGFGK